MKFWLGATIAFVVGFLIGAAPQQCKADTIIGLHLGSVHVPQRQQNNFNPGIYFQTESNWTGGVYHNSLKRTSAYFGKSFEHKFGPVTGGVTLGVISGYEDRGPTRSEVCDEFEYGGRRYVRCKTVVTDDKGFTKHKITPFGAPYLKYEFVKLVVIPALNAKHATVLHLAIEKSFKGI